MTEYYKLISDLEYHIPKQHKIICQMLYIICQILYWNIGFTWLSLCLDDIHDQLQTITEKLQLQLATVKYKLQPSLVVSVEGGIVVDQSRPNTQLADVFNKVFQCLICQALMTSAIYMVVSKC